MAYLQASSNNQKAVTLGAVAAIHALGIYAVITGLAVGWTIHHPPRVETWDVKIEKQKVPPPPQEHHEAKTETAQKVETPVALPPIGNTLPPPPIGPTGGETNAGGKDDDVILPLPSPDPRPLFTAKAPKARGSQGNWVRQSDYPSLAIREEHQGLTRVKLEINELGRVTHCVVTAGSGFDELDAAACARLTDRARFDPATDSSGAKTAGTFSTSVRWQLPEQ